MYRRRADFGAMEQVVFGRPAADAMAGQFGRAHADRPFSMGGGRPNREPSETDNAIRKMTPWIPRNPRKINRAALTRQIPLRAA